MASHKELVAKLRHAIATASNDDLSEAGSDKRSRHVARIDAMSEAASAIEELERENERLTWERNSPDAWRTKLKAAESERDRAVEALRPFAEAARDIDEKDGDRCEMWEHPASMNVTVADFRRARDFLSSIGGGK